MKKNFDNPGPDEPELVQNNFINERVTVNSGERLSRAYTLYDMPLYRTKLHQYRKTFSVNQSNHNFFISLNVALNDRKNGLLA